MRATLVVGFVASLLSLSACGPPCDQSRRCAVDGEAAEEKTVCNGDDFVTCSDANRGEVIFCEAQLRKATCGATGWTIDFSQGQ